MESGQWFCSNIQCGQQVGTRAASVSVEHHWQVWTECCWSAKSHRHWWLASYLITTQWCLWWISQCRLQIQVVISHWGSNMHALWLFFSIYCWCAVYELHYLAGGNVVSWTLFFIVVLGSLLPFLWNFWDLKMPWKGSILSFRICKFIVYRNCHFLRLLMKTPAMPFSVCNLTWVVTSTLRCWYFVVQPIYYWRDESVRRFHNWPPAASQLPLAAVCQSHGTSPRISPALPATTSSRRRSPWRGPVGCNGRDCPVAAASLATYQPSPRNTRRLWRHCRSADYLLLGIT